MTQTIAPKRKTANVAEQGETAEERWSAITRNPSDLLAVMEVVYKWTLNPGY